MGRRLQVIVCLVVLVTAGLINAEIPQVISYQGKVTDSGGVPVADGDYQMGFRIYDAASGGTLEWDSGDQPVTVNSGIFSFLLGESPQPAITLEFDEDYWLLVTFEGDAQNPRKHLGSVGYAYMASGLVAGTEVIGSIDTGPSAAIKATNTSTTEMTYGVYGSTATSEGFGVVGIQPGYVPESDVGSYLKPGGFFGGDNGVMGVSKAQYGFGVLGLSQATTGDGCGGFFLSNAPSGKGVHGEATATMGTNYGVYGSSPSIDGRGVYGYAGSTNGNTYGIYGQSASTSGRGVYGYAGATNGTTYGVHGQSASTDGTGVFGHTSAMTGPTYGGRFESSSASGTGVYGIAWATAGLSHGVHGSSSSMSGRGVYGVASSSIGDTYGVYGYTTSTNGTSVFGHADAETGPTVGVYGETDSASGKGVFGYVTATTGVNYGVLGATSSPTGFGLYYIGGLAGTGTKSCVVETSRGPTLLYCQESPESWFEDFGEGQLANGHCHVELDPLFLETVTIDAENPMKVFVELGDECNGVFVRRDVTGFDVVEMHGGSSSVAFCYRIVAKRKGFEQKRLDYCAAAETDPYPYPELREKELRELENERARMEAERPRREEGQARTDTSG